MEKEAPRRLSQPRRLSKMTAVKNGSGSKLFLRSAYFKPRLKFSPASYNECITLSYTRGGYELKELP